MRSFIVTITKKSRQIKHYSLCCHLMYSVFNWKMKFCLPEEMGRDRQHLVGKMHACALWLTPTFSPMPQYTSKESRLAWRSKVKKAEMTTKLLLCILFIQVLINYLYPSKKCEAAYKKTLEKRVRRVIIPENTAKETKTNYIKHSEFSGSQV